MYDSPEFEVRSSKWNDFKLLVSCFLLLSIVLFSCGNDGSINDAELPKNDSLNAGLIANGDAKIIEPIKDEEVIVLENNGITFTEVKTENNPKAAIDLNTKQFKEGMNQLQFDVDGVDDYTISYLANNYSLSQFSSTNFEVELMYGNNVFLAFLTDATDISIKTNKGCVLKNVVLGVESKSLFDMNQPHLFYYLPQTATNEAILDFYLVNTSISKTGDKVKVVINNSEFILDKWAAYQISGLTKSENAIRIQLLDKNGKLIEGPFNDSGERIFTVENYK